MRKRGVISEIDHFSDKHVSVETLGALKSERSERMGKEFVLGDMVWAKIESFPWWPGYLYDESLASYEVRTNKVDGTVLVAFFGDATYNWLNPRELLRFDSHFNEKSKQSNSKLFFVALEHAMYEFNRRAALGLACPCKSKFQPTKVEGMVNVDMRGYESISYSVEQITKAQQEFQPHKTVTCIKQLALNPNQPQDIHCIEEAARILAFRRAEHEVYDEPYFMAFGLQPAGCVASDLLLGNPELTLVEAWTRTVSRISQNPTESKGVAELRKFCSKRNNVSSQKDEQMLEDCDFSKCSCDHLSDRKAVSVSLKPSIAGKQKLHKIVGQEPMTLSLGNFSEASVHEKLKPAVSETSLKKRSKFHFQQKASSRGQSMNAEVQSENKHVKTMKIRTLTEEPVSSTAGHLSKPPGDHVTLKRSNLVGVNLEARGKKNVTKALQHNENKKEASTLDYPLILTASSVDAQILVKPVEILVETCYDVVKKRSTIAMRKSKMEAESSFKEGQRRAHKRRKTTSIKRLEMMSDIKSGRSSGENILMEKEFGGYGANILDKKNNVQSITSLYTEPSDTCGINLKELPSALKPFKKRPEVQSSSHIHCTRKPIAHDNQDKTSREKVRSENHTEPIPKEEETMLSIKFPPKVKLPSVSELKAKLARFGPLNTSGIRVLWKTSTCQVPFMRSHDAEAAYFYAVKTGTLFCKMQASYHLSGIKLSISQIAETKEPDKSILEVCDRLPPLRSDSESSEPAQSSPRPSESSHSSHVEQIKHFVDAMNMKHQQLEANKSITSDVNKVNISAPMLALLTCCSGIVTKMNPNL